MTSYVHGAATSALSGETLGECLRRVAGRFADRDALVVRAQGRRLDYAGLLAEVQGCAKALLARGIGKGDRVAVCAAPCVEWVIVQLAAATVGAVLAPINPGCTALELERMLAHASASLLFVQRTFRGVELAARARATAVPCVVFEEDFAVFLAAGHAISDAALQAREVGFDDPAALLFTSGTTGAPKAAVLTHHNLRNNAAAVSERLRLTERDRVCIPVPMHHCFGLVGNLTALVAGAAIVVPGGAFDPALALDAVHAESCTALYMVPTMFLAALEACARGAPRPTTLRTGIISGAPCPLRLMDRVRGELGIAELSICYGMTETSPVATQTSMDDDPLRRTRTVGRVLPHLEVKIVDPATGRCVPRGQHGELCVRGYAVMQGYWRDEATTRAAIDGARWMHSGDLAAMDEDGYVNIVGRLKDMIIRGGENVFARDVEDVLRGHPAVRDAQVVGIPSVRYGEEVMAFVQLAGTATDAELEAHCAARLSPFKVPRYWKVVEQFPLTSSGKVQKHRLREMAVAELGLGPPAETA